MKRHNLNINFSDIIEDRVKKELQCPECGSELRLSETRLVCHSCKKSYLIDNATRICSFFADIGINKSKKQIIDWWDDLYQQCYAEDDALLTEDTLNLDLVDLEDMFKKRNHLAFVEMLPILKKNKGLRILEIGPGSGGHAALFSKYGASVTTVDITPNRAVSTANKLKLVGDKRGFSCQGDSEKLPFKSDCFDVVYSNGVLHHTSSTTRAIEEVFRVLKPGGKTVLMLYSRHSALFWLNLVPHAIANTNIFSMKEENWIGIATEGVPKFGTQKNPITRVYSASEIEDLLIKFKIISCRKGSFQFTFFPGLHILRNLFMKLFGFKKHPGCKIVYGDTRYIDTKFELFLGKYFGWDWNIIALKDLQNNK